MVITRVLTGIFLKPKLLGSFYNFKKSIPKKDLLVHKRP